MPYVIPFERRAIERGMKKGVEQGLQQGLVTVMENLEFRFGEIPVKIVTFINQIDDLGVLKMLRRQTFSVESLEKFTQLLHEVWVDKKPASLDTPDSMVSLAV